MIAHKACHMGKRGLGRCREFSWDLIAEHTERVYYELFPSRPPALAVDPAFCSGSREEL